LTSETECLAVEGITEQFRIGVGLGPFVTVGCYEFKVMPTCSIRRLSYGSPERDREFWVQTKPDIIGTELDTADDWGRAFQLHYHFRKVGSQVLACAYVEWHPLPTPRINV
jgi:hypothetical protein